MEPSRILPINSMRSPSALPARRRLGALGLLFRGLGLALPLGAERANFPLQLRHALVGLRRLQAEILAFLVDARQLFLELGSVTTTVRPPFPYYAHQHDEQQAGGDQYPRAPRGALFHGRGCVRSVFVGELPAP